MKASKKTKILIAIALCFVLVSMIGASSVMTSNGEVRVRDLQLVMRDGYTTNAQIYTPKLASADNKLPLIVTVHGAFNNLEMQDLNMVELSRRGFIVISYDMYAHGSSSIATLGSGVGPPIDFTALGDVLHYAVTELSYVDADRIAITGHSGGAAVAKFGLPPFIEAQLKDEDEVRIKAILTVGLDPQYDPYEFEGLDPIYPPLDWGVVAGKFDEWNFHFEDVDNSVVRYLESGSAKTFVNQLEGVDVTGSVEAGKHYTGTIDGQEYLRVIYQPAESHPQNIFSKESAADAIDFFYSSLGVPSGYQKIEPTQQIWQWKQFFNCLGLVGIFLFLAPFATAMIESVPYFAEIKRDIPEMEQGKPDGRRKLIHWILFLFYAAIPALLLQPIQVNWIGKGDLYPGAIGTFSPWFGCDSVNEIAVWAIIIAALFLIAFLVAYYAVGKKSGQRIEGVKVPFKAIWRSFVLAVLTVTVAYVILFAADLIFNVDFRLWVISMRIFNVQKLVFLIAYIPAFLFFYIINSLIVNDGDNLGMPEWLATIKCCVANIGGLVVMIIIQYAILASKGSVPFNAMRIVNIYPLLIEVPVATIISRKLYKKSGNIYLGAFIAAILFTMMTLASTQFYGSILGKI